MPKTILLLPVYNEERVLLDVLERARRHADLAVLVNDASKDSSLRVLRRFARGKRGVYIVDLPENRGMAGALKAGFLFVLHLLKKGRVKAEDIVVTLDADGQHEPENIPRALRHMKSGGYDVALLRRDLANYPLYKVLGNRFLSLTNSILSGTRYQDVECGFRLMKVKVLAPVLAYYTGFRYSCAQEIAFLTARQGFRVDNSLRIRIPFYRHGATMKDGFIVLALSLYTFLRWLLRRPVVRQDEEPLMERSFKGSGKPGK